MKSRIVHALKRCSLFYFLIGFKYYLCNHLIASCPFESVRHAFYRQILGIKIGRGTHISMGQFITGFYNKCSISIGNNCVVNRRCYLDGRIGIRVGNNVNVSFGVVILSLQHECQDPYFSCKGGEVIIGDYSWLGANAIILPNVRIGKGAVVGAGAVVTKDVPDYTIVGGIPARPIGTRNSNLKYVTDFHPFFDSDITNESRKM